MQKRPTEETYKETDFSAPFLALSLSACTTQYHAMKAMRATPLSLYSPGMSSSAPLEPQVAASLSVAPACTAHRQARSTAALLPIMPPSVLAVTAAAV